MKALLLASCAVTLVVCGYTLVELQGKLEQCGAARAELERENAELLVRTLSREAENQAAPFREEERNGDLTSTGSSAPAGTVSDAAPSVRMRSWGIERGVKEIQEVLALGPEEQEQIRQALDAALEEGATSVDREILEKTVADTLGSQRAAQLAAGLAQREERLISQRILKEAAFYSKALRLNPEQEQMLEGALRLIELELKPQRQMLQKRMQEAMSKHFGGDEAKLELQRDYDEIQALAGQIEDVRIDAVLSQMNDSLSDEQKNQLLELKARQVE